MEGNLQRKLKHKWVWECERGGGGVWMMSKCEGVGRNRGDETSPSGLIPLCCDALVFYLQVHCSLRGYGRR